MCSSGAEYGLLSEPNPTSVRAHLRLASDNGQHVDMLISSGSSTQNVGELFRGQPKCGGKDSRCM